jgi:DNA replication protein DnaC
VRAKPAHDLSETLRKLNLTTMVEHYETLAKEAARDHLPHVDYLARLADIERAARYERSVARRIKRARLPNINVVLMGNVGLGKTHLAIALAHSACLDDIPVLFTSAVDIVNTLSAAQCVDNLPRALKRYLTPDLLVVDELGYIPMDKRGADLLFQVISARYERGAIVLTTNTAYKQWPRIFNSDSTITTAVLDRLLHHCETIKIQGKSYRMKDKV